MENAEEENKEEERTSMCAKTKNTESTRLSRRVLMFRITEMTRGNSL